MILFCLYVNYKPHKMPKQNTERLGSNELFTIFDLIFFGQVLHIYLLQQTIHTSRHHLQVFGVQ